MHCKALSHARRTCRPIMRAVRETAATTTALRRAQPALGKAQGCRRVDDTTPVHTHSRGSNHREAQPYHIQEAKREAPRTSSSNHLCRTRAEDLKYPGA